jgi:hypothetical protein
MPASVDPKPLKQTPSPLDATFMKNREEGGPAIILNGHGLERNL